ncbi:hypothetical protein UFOVP1193_45 [uncultured Caudovirales phage]|uniref:Uncharacterized protein n=1 Tax=uncultured Caudovirales phage TaxID=2100421 RepID=A0A6J5R2Q9_9CAUD|nr:hypothetical protein UFOVP1193_45 [uncultured Caudovirales phage]
MTDTLDTQNTKTIEEMVGIYIKIRNRIEETEERHKSELEKIKEEYDIVSQHLLGICNEQNLDSIKTPAGTVSRTITSRYWASDWEQMYSFIKEHDAPQLLERRIHNGNMKQFLEENPDTLPIGLQAESRYTIRVRKPTAK